MDLPVKSSSAILSSKHMQSNEQLLERIKNFKHPITHIAVFPIKHDDRTGLIEAQCDGPDKDTYRWAIYLITEHNGYYFLYGVDSEKIGIERAAWLSIVSGIPLTTCKLKVIDPLIDFFWKEELSVDKSETPLSKDQDVFSFFKNWIKSYEHKEQDLHKSTIVVVKSNSKINQMSKRRAKIAMKKRPRTVFTGCCPISSEETATAMNTVTLDVNYTFKFTEFEEREHE
jgi:hypothetical protein